MVEFRGVCVIGSLGVCCARLLLPPSVPLSTSMHFARIFTAAAVDDFTSAIEAEPRYADFRKRRAQALTALGEDAAALADLAAAAELAPDVEGAAEALGDAARINQRLRDYRRAEAGARVRTAF